MTQVVPGVGNLRFETTHQLVFALRARIEALQAFGDGEIHPLIKTGFEVKLVKFRKAAPVAAIQAFPVFKVKSHRCGLLLQTGNDDANVFRQTRGQ